MILAGVAVKKALSAASVPENVRATDEPLTRMPSADRAAIVPSAALSVMVMTRVGGESASVNGVPVKMSPVAWSSTTEKMLGTVAAGRVMGSGKSNTEPVNCVSVVRPPGSVERTRME